MKRRRKGMTSGIRALKEDLILTGQLPDIGGLKRKLRKQSRQSYERKLDEPVAITPVEYGGLQEAYDHFNRELFGNGPVDCFITYQRRAHSRGYFSADRFSGREGVFGKHEVALNPDTFIGRSDEEICSTLVHEQCHVWQHVFGKLSKRGYHNKEWATKMESLGLQPSSTGAVGGKRTGQRVSHYIIPDGPFAHAFAKLAAIGWKLNLQSAHQPGATKGPSSKTKFTCAACGQNVWGKPDTETTCTLCALEAAQDDPAVVELLRRYRMRAADNEPLSAAALTYDPTNERAHRPARRQPEHDRAAEAHHAARPHR